MFPYLDILPRQPLVWLESLIRSFFGRESVFSLNLEVDKPCSDVANFFSRVRGNPRQLIGSQYPLYEPLAQCPPLKEQSVYPGEMEDIQSNHPALSRPLMSSSIFKLKIETSNVDCPWKLGPLIRYAGLPERPTRSRQRINTK